MVGPSVNYCEDECANNNECFYCSFSNARDTCYMYSYECRLESNWYDSGWEPD